MATEDSRRTIEKRRRADHRHLPVSWQVANEQRLAATANIEAEGRGFEPPTPFGAPDFESGCWPIRLPSEGITNLYVLCGVGKLNARAVFPAAAVSDGADQIVKGVITDARRMARTTGPRLAAYPFTLLTIRAIPVGPLSGSEYDGLPKCNCKT
jgi:hypothetical protein